MIKNCIICGSEFEPKRSDSKFCSVKCRTMFHNGNARAKYQPKAKVKKNCEICGKEFFGNATQKYCSEGCRTKGRAKYERQRRTGTIKVTRRYTKKIKSRPMTPALERFFTKFAMLLKED